MSAQTYAEKGMFCVERKSWSEAIYLFSQAIAQSKSPQWLLARSKAYMETGQLDKALRDAEFAYCTAVERGNDKSRKQMIEAQHRRSVVYFRLKNALANAAVCAAWAMELAKGTAVKTADHTTKHVDANGFYRITEADLEPPPAPSKSEFATISSLMARNNESKRHPYEKDFQREQAWFATMVGFLQKLPADDPARKITVKLVPSKPSLDDKDVEPKEHDPELEAAKVAAKVIPAPEPHNGAFRTDYYQSDKSCNVSLFMKFASKEDAAKVQVDFQPDLITITNVPREPSTAYIVPHAAIDPTKSTSRAITMKVELTLVKAQPGSKWPAYGYESLTKPDASALPKAHNNTIPTDTATPVAPATAAKDKAPVYPTSSKSGPKDWDRMDVDEEEEQNVDTFFQTLYKDATPDTKRAMMKSFQESNGTTLSTNWDEVQGDKVKTNPPDGMVEKKW